ncbi:hypothetical protein RND81_11G176500 [Saponaria officinalis]|uniref:Protein kinase domain-containing protein n=1 Tax=Saponaria officinalis TaxID=3572 RepID=A0AAW1HMH5_SAPOF
MRKEGMQAVFLITIMLWVQLACGSSDLSALLELKKRITTNVVLDSWKANSVGSDGCPLKWRGVTCSDGNVMAITLNDSGLVGEFDFKALSGLKFLRNLSIANNGLTGSILDMAEIESLENLDISRNSFHGSIPSSFTQLKNLVSVNLSANNFEGVLPSGFRNLRKLMYLDLHSNRLSGDVMNLFTELGSVIVVDVSCNQLGGHLDIGLGRASFVSNIQFLNVSNNALVGELFAHDGIPFFDSLEVLDASNNQLNGAVPSFNFVVSLRVLRLADNHLSGNLPEALFQDSSMLISELDLSSNQLQGPVGSITSTSLRSLNLSSNQLSGSLPMKIGQCVMIDLSNNNFSGNLSRIKYWGNYVEVIQLSSNALTGTLPNETPQFLRLSSFKLSNNSLHGILPPVIDSYPELKVIDLSFNQLNGRLLPSLFSSTKLAAVNLSHNNFTGTIPPSDNLNASLTSLDLSYNFLSGDIPITISNLRNLMYLDLVSNNFQGSIPSNLSEQLIDLNVSYNNLSGSVPENLWRFPETAFHPGNSLLILPPSSSVSPHSSKSHNQRKHRVVIDFILVGIIGGALVLALLFMLIYYRIHMKERRGKDHQMTKSEGRSDNKSGTSSLSSTSPSRKSTDDPSITTPSSLKMGPAPDPENSRTLMTKCENIAPSESSMKSQEGEIMAPVPITRSTNTSLNILENLGAIKIGSPDSAGDLHMFDGSLSLTAEQLSGAPAEVIGRSCHGLLYRATLSSGHILVVKRLKVGIAKGKKEFAREARKLGNVRHPNLVSLQGYYCGTREHQKLIMSNYINSPCLGIYLQGPERSQIPYLSLDKRLKISREIAHCLDYLHNEKAIPHGNLKSTNILIDPSDANTLVTDYSLHRLLTPAGTADQVLNAGALGYLPPEFITSTKPCPSLKSDVYAFGVILLELITGRSSAEIVTANQGAVDLTDWVKLLVAENRASHCFDKAGLGINFTEIEQKVLHKILQVALSCILPASERPDITTVLHDLLSIELN